MNSFYKNWVMYQKDLQKQDPQNNAAAKLSISKKSKKIGGQGS